MLFACFSATSFAFFLNEINCLNPAASSKKIDSNSRLGMIEVVQIQLSHGMAEHCFCWRVLSSHIPNNWRGGLPFHLQVDTCTCSRCAETVAMKPSVVTTGDSHKNEDRWGMGIW